MMGATSQHTVQCMLWYIATGVRGLLAPCDCPAGASILVCFIGLSSLLVCNGRLHESPPQNLLRDTADNVTWLISPQDAETTEPVLVSLHSLGLRFRRADLLHTTPLPRASAVDMTYARLHRRSGITIDALPSSGPSSDGSREVSVGSGPLTSNQSLELCFFMQGLISTGSIFVLLSKQMIVRGIPLDNVVIAAHKFTTVVEYELIITEQAQEFFLRSVAFPLSVAKKNERALTPGYLIPTDNRYLSVGYYAYENDALDVFRKISETHDIIHCMGLHRDLLSAEDAMHALERYVLGALDPEHSIYTEWDDSSNYVLSNQIPPECTFASRHSEKVLSDVQRTSTEINFRFTQRRNFNEYLILDCLYQLALIKAPRRAVAFLTANVRRSAAKLSCDLKLQLVVLNAWKDADQFHVYRVTLNQYVPQPRTCRTADGNASITCSFVFAFDVTLLSSDAIHYSMMSTCEFHTSASGTLHVSDVHVFLMYKRESDGSRDDLTGHMIRDTSYHSNRILHDITEQQHHDASSSNAPAAVLASSSMSSAVPAPARQAVVKRTSNAMCAAAPCSVNPLEVLCTIALKRKDAYNTAPDYAVPDAHVVPWLQERTRELQDVLVSMHAQRLDRVVSRWAVAERDVHSGSVHLLQSGGTTDPMLQTVLAEVLDVLDVVERWIRLVPPPPLPRDGIVPSSTPVRVSDCDPFAVPRTPLPVWLLVAGVAVCIYQVLVYVVAVLAFLRAR